MVFGLNFLLFVLCLLRVPEFILTPLCLADEENVNQNALTFDEFKAKAESKLNQMISEVNHYHEELIKKNTQLSHASKLVKS
jgi:hypothetical protein